MVDLRPVGTSAMQVAPLVLGGNVFGWTADEATSFRLLDAFVDAGGTMIDTADVYSAWVAGHKGGESETVIGNWLKRDPAKRAKVQIATKVGFMAGLAPEHDRAGLRRVARAAGDRDDRPLLSASGRSQSAARRQPRRVRRASPRGQDRGHRAERISTRRGSRKRWRSAATAGSTRRSRCRTGIICSSANGSRGRSPMSLWAAVCRCSATTASPMVSCRANIARRMTSSSRCAGFATSLMSKATRAKRCSRRWRTFPRKPASRSPAVAIAWTKAQPGITGAIASATRLEQLEELVAGMSLDLTPAQIEALTAASN